ncbi:MAG: PKD domain-containing protein [Bacteroidales bacterium]|nr:PKD domain-containing protein [Bacteroidales bacterium]
MKRLLFLSAVLGVVTAVQAFNGFEAQYSRPAPDQMLIEFQLAEFQLEDITIDGTTYTNILFDGSVTTREKGFAALPYIHASVMLPADKNMTLKILGGDYTDYNLSNPMLPSRGVIYRDQDPSAIPYAISPASYRDAWYPGDLAVPTDPFILRDVRGMTVYAYPYQYNAVQNRLRVYHSLTVKLVEDDTPVINPLVKNDRVIAREMNAVYSSLFINYGEPKYDLTIGEYGEILVVMTDRDVTAMEPYIQWKKEKGYQIGTEVVSMGTNVKTTIQNAYAANNNILYVQLVGDWADIKSDVTGGAPMDPQLGCVAGSDQYPDICIGRISANSAAQVTTQVEKFIQYEKMPEMGGTWYSKATGIASNQGPGDDGELDKEHIQNIYDNKLDPFTYDGHSPIYDPTANIQMVNTAVNNGTSIINYCGHGSATSWGTTGFSNSNVAALTNGGMLPWVVSVACNNGNFHDPGDCFAEAWVKKANGGAVMFLGATISQPWDPPMRGQDYFNDVFIGGYDYSLYPGQNGITTTEQRTTLGAIVFNGLVLMVNESGGPDDWETAKTWTLFGDPSLQARSETPGNLLLSNNVILVGVPFTTTVTGTNGPVEGAMVCISQGDLFFSAVTDATGSVSIDNTLSPGTAKLVVTGFNTETLYEDIDVVPPNGPWVIVSDYSVDDAVTGNGNGMADYGETVNLDVEAQNVGNDPAVGVNAVISSTDPYVTITDDSHSFGTIAAGQTLMGDNAFTVDISGDAPDLHQAVFEVEFTDGNKASWASTLAIQLHAADLLMGDVTVNDPSGNGNGKIDPGETVDIKIEISNDGSAGAYNVTGLLSCPDPFITVIQDSQDYGDIAPGETKEKSFSVQADQATPQGHMATFILSISADLGVGTTGEFSLVIGQVPVLVIDLDGNHNSAPAIVQAIEDYGISPEQLNNLPPSLNLYSSIFMCLGVYPDNHVLTSSEGQQLADFLNQGGALYMEGGDTWYYDPATPVHIMFGIVPQEDGSSDLGTVLGQTGTFTEGMSFTYSGDNNWIDHIGAASGADLIFKNQSPTYGCGVAYDQGTYKTIGCSFEFGGLTDGNTPSTKEELMAEYLNFFGVAGQTLLAYFMADQTEICEGETVQFSDYSQGNVTSWAWEFPGGTPATSTEQDPAVTYNAAGVYDVTLTVSDGSSTNTFTRTDYITVNTCTGTGKFQAARLSVYPNPSASGIFNLTLPESDSRLNLKVLNLLQELLFETSVDPTQVGSTTLNLSHLSEGIYLLVVSDGTNASVQRIVISK